MPGKKKIARRAIARADDESEPNLKDVALASSGLNLLRSVFSRSAVWLLAEPLQPGDFNLKTLLPIPEHEATLILCAPHHSADDIKRNIEWCQIPGDFDLVELQISIPARGKSDPAICRIGNFLSLLRIAKLNLQREARPQYQISTIENSPWVVYAEMKDSRILREVITTHLVVIPLSPLEMCLRVLVPAGIKVQTVIPRWVAA